MVFFWRRQAWTRLTNFRPVSIECYCDVSLFFFCSNLLISFAFKNYVGFMRCIKFHWKRKSYTLAVNICLMYISTQWMVRSVDRAKPHWHISAKLYRANTFPIKAYSFHNNKHQPSIEMLNTYSLCVGVLLTQFAKCWTEEKKNCSESTKAVALKDLDVIITTKQ